MRKWKDVLTLSEHMILSIEGRGRHEEYDDEGNLTDSDDLALAIQLPVNRYLLLPSKNRLVMNKDGSITVQLLKKGNEEEDE